MSDLDVKEAPRLDKIPQEVASVIIKDIQSWADDGKGNEKKREGEKRDLLFI